MRGTLSLTLLFIAIGVWAGEPNESDYTIQYEVTVSQSTDVGFLVGNVCTMSLIDKANPSVVYVVSKKGHGSCHVSDAKTVLKGRRDKNKIDLLIKDDKGKLQVERWPIFFDYESPLPSGVPT